MARPSRIDESLARKMYAAGALDSEIAAACGVSKMSVCHWRHRRNLKSRWTVIPLTASDKAKALELYRAGCSDREIARQLKVLCSTITGWRHREGLVATRVSRRGLKDKVLRLLDKGLTPNQVAAKLNCASAYVRATRARRKNPEQTRMWSRAKDRAHAELIGRPMK